MNLCTRAEAVEFLKMTEPSEAQNDFIDGLIVQCSDVIAQYCNRTFDMEHRTELYSGDGSHELYLDNYPIINIVKMSDDFDDDDNTVGEEIDLDQIRVQKNIGCLFWKQYLFPCGNLNIYVEYYSGYLSTDIPEALKQVCLSLVARKFKQSDEGRFGLESINVMGKNVNFVNLRDLSAHEKKTVSMFRKPPTGNKGWSLELS